MRAFARCVMVAGVLAVAVSGIAKDSPEFVRITPADLKWHDVADGRGVQQATLLGDPSKPGIYVIRVRFPPHIMDVPHWHPNARYVTVSATEPVALIDRVYISLLKIQAGSVPGL